MGCNSTWYSIELDKLYPKEKCGETPHVLHKVYMICYLWIGYCLLVETTIIVQCYLWQQMHYFNLFG